MHAPGRIRLAAVVGLALVGCFQPPIDPAGDCMRLGTCECATRADCSLGLECVDGRCRTAVLDAGPLKGEPGALCLQGGDCNSGICLPEGPGRPRVCTVACGSQNDGGDGGEEDSACPGSWQCKPGADGGIDLCVPPYNALCLSCAADSDCNVQGDLCVPLAGEKFCARACVGPSDCPSGYRCSEVLAENGESRGTQCLPEAGSCECSDLNVGLGRACRQANATGTCYGFEVCQPDGTWAGCDARAPSREVCSGQDDDCDGLVDHDDPSVDTSSLAAKPPYPGCQVGDGGACVGTWICRPGQNGGFGWECGAAEPREELCNGLDEDCNGIVDEPFLDPQGRYLDLHHCGACGYDCEAAVKDLALAQDGGVQPGAVSCQVRGNAPTCVPKLCATGYAPFPPAAPVICQRVVGSSCRTCSVDADCGPFGDRCSTLGGDPGRFCLQGCGLGAPYPGCTGAVGQQGCCPQGYTCEQRGADRLCVPGGDSCTCRPAREGAERSCLVSVQSATCVGTQVCQGSGEWDVCDTALTTVEVCDGLDNNCDGKVDEPFINTRGTGTYDSDEHCGACQNNCKAMWNVAIQHAIGGCVTDGGTQPNCQIVACTQQWIPGGNHCGQDADCGAGRVCDPLYRQCVRACGSAADCAGRPCVEGFCTATCSNDQQCQQALGTPSTCQGGTCGVRYQFVNADQEPTNGCECPRALGVVDVPDIYDDYPLAGAAYVDRDCDGLDGVATSSLFVRAGSGGNGTRLAPYGTISQALAAFNPATHSAILVAQGSYLEQVVLKNGVKLYGGYRSDFARRDVVTFPTLIEAHEPNFQSAGHRRGTVNAESLTQPTVLAGFTIRGYDVTYRPAAGGAGKNSYAVYVKNTGSALTLANNRIIGGRGGDAAHGNPGAAGGSGTPGGNGLDSKECTTSTCNNQSQPGGAGGANAACSAARGNPGAASAGGVNPQAYQQPLGKNGRGGWNGTYSNQGNPSISHLCKYDCQVGGTQAGQEGMNGKPAQNGVAGSSLSGGQGCGASAGSLVGDEWVAGGGALGSQGSDGTGGGGGGGGGAVTNNNGNTSCTVGNRLGDLGGTGGGGGAGGCGGRSGNGGGGGGGSFGVFIAFTSAPTTRPTVKANLIEVGSGGNGGNGGNGGYGGHGGQGGEGGVAKLPAWCAGLGGKGGRGGNGGGGSGGGGGCGGSAFGIAGNSIGPANYGSRNSIGSPSPVQAGSPGAGGASPSGATSAGASGSTGQVGTVTSF